MVKFVKQVFIVLLNFSRSLPRAAKASDRPKCIPIKNESCLATPTLIDLNSNEIHYYPFMVNLDRCNARFNILDDFSSRICIPNKLEDVSLNMFNMITKINESKTLKTHSSCGCKFGVDRRKCYSD